MLNSLFILWPCIALFRWGLLLGICFILYRRFSLPSLPWLGAHYAIALLCWPFARYVDKYIPDYVAYMKQMGSLTLGQRLELTLGLTVLLGEVMSLLIVILITSEIAHFVIAHHPEIRSKFLSCLTSARTHVAWFGMALIALTLTQPIMIFIIWNHHRR